MNIQINKIHFPVTALGPGKRLGIWFQGCSIRCPGCISRDTWVSDPDRNTTVQELLDAVASLTACRPDGITISGGEPFEQPAALRALLEGVRQWPARRSGALDILVYSGKEVEVLEDQFSDILCLVDGVISDPYIAGSVRSEWWRGSDNQRLSVFTRLGASRYGEMADGATSAHSQIQLSVDNTTVWMIGIPRPGDLGAIERAAAARGVSLGRVSWRA